MKALAPFVVSVVVGCGSARFPPPVAAPVVTANRGVTIMLVENDQHRPNTPAFREALIRDLAQAGFHVTWPKHGDKNDPFDVGVTFGLIAHASKSAEWEIELTLANPAEHVPEGYSFQARFQAIHNPDDKQKAIFPDVDSVRFVNRVSGPSADDATQEDDAGAASLLVNNMVRSPSFAQLVNQIRESGVATVTPMEKLSTAALFNACRRSEFEVNDDQIVWGTGAVRRMDDACAIVVTRDPRLAADVQQIRQSRGANASEYVSSGRAQAREEALREQDDEERRDRAQVGAARDQREEALRAQHDAAMRQLPAAVDQAVVNVAPAARPVAVAPVRRPPPPPAPAPSPVAAAEAQKQQQEHQQRAIQLQQCLAEPITPMRVAGQSNPFLADVQGFQALVDKAHGECLNTKTWAAWNECMGSNAMNALWSVEERAIADSGDLFKRYTAVASFYTTPAVCLEPHFKGTRDNCMLNTTTVDLVRGNCVQRLQENIDVLNCELKMLPGVWNAEAARDDAAAHTRHDADCTKRFGN